jgi:hypothetical protein
MSEAIGKLENLITASQAQAEASPLLFPLAQEVIVREIEVVYGEDERVTLYHKIKWPTLGALIERQKQTPYKSEVLGAGKIRAQNDDGVAANAKLWDKFRSQVRGYEWNGLDPDQWVDVSDELAAEIPSEHKSEAIVGLFASNFEIERPKGKGYVLGAVSYRVKQTYGPYTIWHVFNKPAEKDRRDLARKSRETHGTPGAIKGKSEVFTNLKPYVEMYDKIFDHLEGVTGEDPDIASRKDLISGVWKLGAIDALMESFEASRRDLSKN